MGRQVLSVRNTEASCSWAASTMTRDKYSVQFVSKNLAQFKKGSRDPAQYRTNESAFGELHAHELCPPLHHTVRAASPTCCPVSLPVIGLETQAGSA